jgi:hypothetical protein
MPRIPQAITCQHCGKTHRTRNVESRYCSHECATRALYPQPTIETLPSFYDVKADTGCWLWNHMVYGGRGWVLRGRGGPREPAYRFVWELLRGEIPDGLNVCHDCPGGDNPLCVNPDHLFLGTQRENLIDASRKGRLKVGEANKLSRLTVEQVREIRAKYEAGGVSYRQLASEYGVHPPTLWKVVTRRTWQHV